MISIFRLNVYILLSSAIIFYSHTEETDENECYDVKNYYWKHLSSKTAYRYVANRNDTKIQFEGCVPKKIWMVIRHGTRYAKEKLIHKMNGRLMEIRNNIDNKKGTLCEVHALNITQWTPQMEISEQKMLSHEGEDEMIELAERFQNRFPDLLTEDYSNSTYKFRSTATQRTIKSKYYFTVGLFGKRVAGHVWSPEPIYKDPVLRFYKLCNKWIKSVKKNPKAKSEVGKFLASDTYKKVLDNLKLKSGQKNLTFEDLELIYLVCSYESSLNRYRFSPWCSLFSEEDMKVMEFSRELGYYWESGYGHEINFQQACPLMEDFLQFVQSEEGPTSSFLFTHSGALLKFLSHLGLYYDEFKLTHEKYESPRLWKSSYIDAFGSNVAFVTFQCGDQRKVLTLHQERPVKLPGCPKEGLCSFEKLLKVYKNSFLNCQFSEICKLSK